MAGISKQRMIGLIASGFRQLRDPYYQGFAAQVAFFLLLSVVPTIILLSQILGIFDISTELLRGWIETYMTGKAAHMFLDLFNYVPSGATNAAFVVVALWSASRAQFAMLRITNYTFSGGETTGKGYLRDRLRAIFMIVVTLFTVTFALVILVYGRVILRFLLHILVDNIYLLQLLDRFWNLLRWPVAMTVYFLMVSFNYYVLPSQRVRFREVVPGSILAATGMLLVTGAFSWYLGTAANYDIIYGSLASMVALMVWFYLIAWTLGIGVIFNKAWRDTAAQKTPKA